MMTSWCISLNESIYVHKHYHTNRVSYIVLKKKRETLLRSG